MSESNPIDAAQASLPSTHSKDARQRDRINTHMVQNVLAIWLDVNIDENSSDCQNTITHLRRTINTIQTFTDDIECFQFLEEIANEKACMIISGALGEQVVPRVHALSQVHSIFIFCDNKKDHEGWTKDWSKIKGVFTEIRSICEALKQAAQECEQNTVSISIIGHGVEKAGNRLDPSFMYRKIMTEIFLTISFEQKHIDEFMAHCREAFAGNEDQFEYVNQLDRQYRRKTPIWWYTCENFLYPMLNRALRLMDVDLMIKMGFFIADLHRQIEQLHQVQFGGNSSKQHWTLYRGQGMDKEAFNKMAANKGGLMSFNSFLSISKKCSTSLELAKRAPADNQMVGVLFVMNIDPTRSDTPFASVVDVGYYGEKEDEVLFSMHSVFRIGEITLIDGNARLVQVQLNLASEKDNDLRDLMEYIREETFPDSEGWYRLGSILRKMGEFAKAQWVYEMLLAQEAEEYGRAPIYHQIGVMKQGQGEYTDAIEYYEKSIEIEEKQIPRDDLCLAMSYNNIGLVYDSMGDYPKALSSHEKVLAIRQQLLSPSHPNLASSYNNIGNVFKNMGDYPKALSFYEKSLAIQQQSLPTTHLSLASSYHNIGIVYRNMDDYPKALSSYEKSLAIKQQSLPPTHPDLASSYNNIGVVYRNMDDYPKALSSYEKALTIQQQSLPPIHPDLAASCNNIGNVYSDMGDYPRALSFYENALTIKQQSLPPTHPSLASAYDNIGLVHDEMGNYSKAYLCFERAVDIAQRSLPENHPDLLNYRNELARIKQKL